MLTWNEWARISLDSVIVKSHHFLCRFLAQLHLKWRKNRIKLSLHPLFGVNRGDSHLFDLSSLICFLWDFLARVLFASCKLKLIYFKTLIILTPFAPQWKITTESNPMLQTTLFLTLSVCLGTDYLVQTENFLLNSTKKCYRTPE